MIKRIRTTGLLALVLGVVCIGWWVYDMIAFEHIKPRLLSPADWGPLEDTLGGLVWVGFLVFLVFHIPALLTILFRIQFFKKLDWKSGSALALGLLSLFALIGDYGLLNDIGKETRLTGEPQSEWIILYYLMIIHALFFLVMLAVIFRTFRELRREPGPEEVFKDEIIFNTAQWMGVVCGAVGLWVNFSFLMRQVPPHKFVFLVPFYLLILIPYGLTVLSWLLLKRGEKPADWYDEKQWQDMTKAALVTLLLSLPGMGVLLLVPKPLGLYWFPHYVFLALFLFSAFTLFFIFREEA
jgi:hypothetical protein